MNYNNYRFFKWIFPKIFNENLKRRTGVAIRSRITNVAAGKPDCR